jgi:uncharacterized sodium:solute symporter family permease YidK
MSSLDSTLNFSSGIFANDIYRKVMNPNADSEHMLKVSRLSTVGLGALSIGLALAMSAHGGAFSFMILMDKIFVTPIVVPLLMGLFFPRRGSRAALATFLVVTPYNLLAVYLLDLPYSTFMLSSFVLAYVVYFAGGLLLKDSGEKKREIAEFFRKLETPVETAAELKSVALDKLPMLSFIGRMACVTGISISLLVLIPQAWPERLKILAGGVAVLGIGLMMLYYNWRKDAEKNAATVSQAEEQSVIKK